MQEPAAFPPFNIDHSNHHFKSLFFVPVCLITSSGAENAHPRANPRQITVYMKASVSSTKTESARPSPDRALAPFHMHSVNLIFCASLFTEELTCRSPASHHTLPAAPAVYRVQGMPQKQQPGMHSHPMLSVRLHVPPYMH